MKIKFIGIAVFVSLIVLSFTGCNSEAEKKTPEKFVTSSSSKAVSRQDATDGYTEKPIANIPSQTIEEFATIVSTNPQNGDDTTITNVYGCVSTEKEEKAFSKEANDYVTYKIPRINLSSFDASRVNDEIKEKYNEQFESISDDYKTDTDCLGIDYSYYTTQDIVSVVIKAQYKDNCVYHQVYNFDMSTGEQMDNYNLLGKLGKSFSDIKDTLKQAISDDYDKNYNSIGLASSYTKNLEKTLSDSNIDDVKLFIDENNELCAICKEYSDVGAGSYEHKVIISL